MRSFSCFEKHRRRRGFFSTRILSCEDLPADWEISVLEGVNAKQPNRESPESWTGRIRTWLSFPLPNRSSSVRLLAKTREPKSCDFTPSSGCLQPCFWPAAWKAETTRQSSNALYQRLRAYDVLFSTHRLFQSLILWRISTIYQGNSQAQLKRQMHTR